MPAIGSKVGVFEITGTLGAGGMGEVYRARDTQLNRDVAIKVLPELFAVDAERVARFTREAHTLAALNHPNIAQIYGIERDLTSGQPRALVMELVEGETLAELIERNRGTQRRNIGPSESEGWQAAGVGPRGIPIEDALPIARQIIAALEAAHEVGIIHRDLKPANIKVRGDGVVKVLDFGLAKAVDPAGSAASDAMQSPTLTARATAMGTIIGTAAYMAPEQAKGKAVDKRADIWAFGVVLYEMLTGRRAFDGDDTSTVLASVLMREPVMEALPAEVPSRIRGLIARCLVKDPKQRLRDIGDARLVLDDSSEQTAAPSAARAGSPLPSTPFWRRALPPALSALLTFAVLAAIYMTRRPAAGEPEVLRFSLSVGSGSGGSYFRSQSQVNFVFTNDGRALIYGSAIGTGARYLSMRRLDQLANTAIAGTDGAIGPFISPDDKWVGFLDPGFTYITKAPTAGGVAVRVVQARRNILSATWTSDNTIVFGGIGSALSEVPADGGEPKELTRLDAAAGDTSHIWPAAVPGSKGVLFTIPSGDPLRTSRLAVLDRSTGRVTRTELRGTFPKILRPGHVVYADANGSLFVVPFDARRLEFTGAPTPLGVQVGVASSGSASFDIGPDGRLAFAAPGIQDAARTLVWVDRTGKEVPLTAPTRAYYYARVSPDGSRLSLDIRDQDQDLWTWDMRGTLARVTHGPNVDQYGLWTPDGKELICVSLRDGKQGLYRTRADGVGEPALITDAAGAYPNALTPDGKQLVFRSAVGSKGHNDLLIVPLGTDPTVKPLIATEFDELNASISPDGRWMAFESNLSGRPEIYVRPFPDVNSAQWRVSTGGGVKPGWTSNGREVYFLSTDQKMMVVPVTTTNVFSPGTPVPLFDASPYFTMGSGRNFDISRDGTRFILSKLPASSKVPDAINIVINWAAEVAAKLPGPSR